MGMVVQHNISAMNANEAMRKNVAGLKKQTEKLSTGYNINRAADNAAGLAISEKMRSQIRGLTQATSNSNDAISLIQTAEGGLQETEDILQRMRELSVQSANGTYTDEDREQIQFEVDALKAEVDRISEATEYNTMKLLDGSLSGTGSASTEYGAKYGVINDGVTETEKDAIKADTTFAAEAADIGDKIAALDSTKIEDSKILDTLKKDFGIEQVLADDGSVDDTATKALVVEAMANMNSDKFNSLVSLKKPDDTDPNQLNPIFAETAYGNYDKVSKLLDKAGNASEGFDGAVVTSNVQGASINVTTGATKNGESAAWDEEGKTLTLNLVEGKTYTQEDVDKLIKNADTKKADGVVAEVTLKLKDGVYSAKNGDYTAKTNAGVRAESKTISLLANDNFAYNMAYDKAKAAGEALTDATSADLTGSDDAATLANKKVAAEIAKSLGYNSWEDMNKADSKNVADAIMSLDDDQLADLYTNLDTLATGATNATKLADAKDAVGDGTAATDFEADNNIRAIFAYAKSLAGTTPASAADEKKIAMANGVVASREGVNAGVLSAPTTGYGDQIKFTSNSYGIDTRTFEIATDVKVGSESVEPTIDDTMGNKDGKYTIHLATGVEYSNEDIEKLMQKAGLDYTVNITDSAKPDGDVKMKLDIAVSQADATATAMDKGVGVGKEEIAAIGEGLTFQIGANGVEDQRLTVNIDDMSSKALGVNDISVAKQDDANDAINKLDDAIKKVSTQRAKLGAVQNRLEHTVNSLNTANENLTASESQIRDTDMAAEMIKYTKSNILQQASQSMLAQANQQPQGVLQLLG